MKVMKLRSQETVTGKKEFIVMGTTYVCGEGIQCKGKVTDHTHYPHPPPSITLVLAHFWQIKIFDVIEVIPEPGKPLTKNRIKVRGWLLMMSW